MNIIIIMRKDSIQIILMLSISSNSNNSKLSSMEIDIHQEITFSQLVITTSHLRTIRFRVKIVWLTKELSPQKMIGISKSLNITQSWMESLTFTTKEINFSKCNTLIISTIFLNSLHKLMNLIEEIILGQQHKTITKELFDR